MLSQSECGAESITYKMTGPPRRPPPTAHARVICLASCSLGHDPVAARLVIVFCPSLLQDCWLLAVLGIDSMRQALVLFNRQSHEVTRKHAGRDLCVLASLSHYMLRE